jgi:hypothetical protein
MVTASGSVFAGASMGPSFVSFDALRPEIWPFIVVVFFGYKKIYRLSFSLSLSLSLSLSSDIGARYFHYSVVFVSLDQFYSGGF